MGIFMGNHIIHSHVFGEYYQVCFAWQCVASVDGADKRVVGDDFLNLVASFESEKSPQAICEDIETIHNLVGRSREGGKWASRPLDIDLLLYNDLIMSERPVRVPREDILEYSFVLRPLAELAPDLVHPVTGRTMLEHWQEFDASRQPLEVVGVML